MFSTGLFSTVVVPMFWDSFYKGEFHNNQLLLSAQTTGVAMVVVVVVVVCLCVCVCFTENTTVQYKVATLGERRVLANVHTVQILCV